jgi:hypothetical protein
VLKCKSTNGTQVDSWEEDPIPNRTYRQSGKLHGITKKSSQSELLVSAFSVLFSCAAAVVCASLQGQTSSSDNVSGQVLTLGNPGLVEQFFEQHPLIRAWGLKWVQSFSSITSVDLITAETVSPTFSFISSRLRLVITLSIRFVPARTTT